MLFQAGSLRVGLPVVGSGMLNHSYLASLVRVAAGDDLTSRGQVPASPTSWCWWSSWTPFAPAWTSCPDDSCVIVPTIRAQVAAAHTALWKVTLLIVFGSAVSLGQDINTT